MGRSQKAGISVLPGATNGVPKDGPIIAIGSGRTSAACVKRNRA
jgi:hypothetical protein